MIKAIIFDFDDTLCMTSGSNYRMISIVLQQLGQKPITLQEFQKTVGDPLKVTLTTHYPGVNLDEFMDHLNLVRADLLAKKEIENIPQQNLDALDELARSGKQLFVVTSRREEGMKHAMDPSHHLGSRIAHFYHLGNNPYHKPDPKTFAVIEEKHELNPTECVYIGDSLNDASAAKGAGMRFIACLENQVLTEEDFADYEVDAFVSKLPEIVSALVEFEK